MSEVAAVLAAKSLDQPDEVRRFPRGSLAVVQVDDATVGRAVFEPGWRWSEHVRPLAGTEWCLVRHVGYILSGRMGVALASGQEAEAGPGDVVVIDGDHDGWVVGEEPCVMLDWAGGASYARVADPAD